MFETIVRCCAVGLQRDYQAGCRNIPATLDQGQVTKIINFQLPTTGRSRPWCRNCSVLGRSRLAAMRIWSLGRSPRMIGQ